MPQCSPPPNKKSTFLKSPLGNLSDANAIPQPTEITHMLLSVLTMSPFPSWPWIYPGAHVNSVVTTQSPSLGAVAWPPVFGVRALSVSRPSFPRRPGSRLHPVSEQRQAVQRVRLSASQGCTLLRAARGEARCPHVHPGGVYL